MADVTVKVLTPAANFDLLTLDEAKLLLGMSKTDTSQDEALTMMISIYSAYVAEICNRTFAKEKVTETWRETYDGRLFLTHWPVAEGDIESVSSACVDLFPDEYELEEASGKLSYVGNPCGPEATPWPWPAIVTYTGGFDLPIEAPLPLKQATVILIREEKMRMQQAQVAGIRQVSHKDSRVAFFDPNMLLIKTAGVKSPGTQAAESLLRQYMRFWV